MSTLCLILSSCKNNEKAQLEKKYGSMESGLQEGQADSIAIRQNFDTSPVLSPKESIETMDVEKGFEIRLVAAEPLVNAPIALTFDHRGRIWVVEMSGFMPNPEGIGEDIPNGKIVILEDKNGDGAADERKVFLDSLILPRAISLIDDGILVAEPPNLWFYKINNDKPGKKMLVDGEYADGGNVEHQPNGLLRAMDNWIYNAKSSKRYKKKGNKWIIEKTHFRGQWGISQDNYGRLYYNNNTTNLIGDYFNPGLGTNNKNQRDVAGFRERIVSNNKVYPASPTPGVNRGYMEGILDDSLRLVNFTAACGPVIYRGNMFGEEFQSNGFVAEPAGNLIKRNILKKEGYITKGAQAYEGKEFIASSDERFRPTNLFNGPDGALYITDMYRGIIQHTTYLTPYLKNEIESRHLTLPLSCGRIYRVVPENTKTKNKIIPKDPNKLVGLLGHSNGWVRDKAQQKLIDWNFKVAIPDLQNALNETNNPFLVMHALWTLEGLEALKTQEVLTLLKEPNWPIQMQALSVLPSVMEKKNYEQYLTVLEHMIEQNDTLAAPYVAFVAVSIETFDETAAIGLLQKVVKKYPDNKYVADAAISSLQGYEENFLKELTTSSPNETFVIVKGLERIVKKNRDSRKAREQEILKKEFPKGAALFSKLCQTCHGEDGTGVEFLAPPLDQSDWVTGSKNRLTSIVLFGLSGQIEVNGHLYENGVMPSIGHDKSISDEDVAQLLSYIRNSWENSADKVSAQEVKKIRQKFKDRDGTFTVEELDALF